MSNLFSVAILAGGLATRLYPVTQTIPKALVRVKDQYFIDYQLQTLKQQGIKHIVLCVGYLGEMIEKYLGNGQQYGLKIEYSYDGPKLLGTAGALKRALPLLPEHFFILYGDSYLRCDYQAVQQTYMKNHKFGLMTVFRNEGKWDKSNIIFSQNEITLYDKKNYSDKMQYIDYGIGILNRMALDQVLDETPYDLADVYQYLLKMKQLAAFEVKDRFYEVGSFTGIAELEEYLTALDKIKGVSEHSLVTK